MAWQFPVASLPLFLAAYRAAVRLALRDRVLTREEERHLLRLARHAGIGPTRALDIHDEVEREREAPP